LSEAKISYVEAFAAESCESKHSRGAQALAENSYVEAFAAESCESKHSRAAQAVGRESYAEDKRA